MANLDIKTKYSSSGYNDAQKKIRGMRNALGGIGKDANRASATLRGVSSATGAMKAVAGIATYVGLTRAVKSSIVASMEAIETQNLFNVALGDMAKVSDEAVQSMSQLYGLDPTNLRDAVGTYALLANTMGFTTQQSEVLSRNMTRLALDLGSLTNVPFEQVLGDLRSGLVGQSETVYKYGLDVTEAGLKAEAMAEGISKSVRNMSQGEKMALRYNAMIRQTAKVQGDFANTIQSPANQLRILQSRMVTLGRSIGNIFLPILSTVLPYLNALTIVLTKVANAIAKFFGYSDEKFAQNSGTGLSSAGIDAEDTSDSIDNATKSAKKFKNVLGGIDEINTLNFDSGDSSSGAGAGAGAGGGSILDSIGLLDPYKIFGEYDDVANGIADRLIGKFQRLNEIIGSIPLTPFIVIGSILGGIAVLTGFSAISEAFLGIAVALDGMKNIPIIGGFLSSLSEVALMVAGYFEGFASVIAGLSTGAFAGLVAVIALVIYTLIDLWNNSERFRTSVIDTFTAIGDFIKTVIESLVIPVLNALMDTFNYLLDVVILPLYEDWKFVFEDIAVIIGEVIQFIAPLFGTIVKVLGVVLPAAIKALGLIFGSVFGAIGSIVGGLFKTISQVLGNVKGVFNGIITFLSGVFTGNWKKIFGGLRDIITNLLGGIYNIIKIPFNIINDGINGVVRAINGVHLDIPSWVPFVGGKSFSVKLPYIPRLATGGSLEGGQLFIGGEGGKIETAGTYKGKTTVMPLQNTDFVQAIERSVYRGALQAFSQPSNGAGQDIVLKVGSTELARTTINGINRVTAQEGKLLIKI